MTERQFAVLRDLDDKLFLRPMDIGGRDASHHSKTLAQLVRLGLAMVDRKRKRGDRSGKRYRRTPAGRTAALGTRPIDLLATGGAS